ncbi:hypothetical protein [Arcobacter sp. s6]|uniref:hypothetical protein n=1 Tax=Arcobacter sp. s6 TaxID=3230363 RepID=UPI0034A00136
MKDFIKVELFLKISGFDINKDGTFQIQNVSLNDAGKLVKNTVKVHKNLSEETLKPLLGKCVKIEGVEEYKNGFKTYYSGKDIKRVDKDLDFELNKEITLKVDNVVENKEDTVLQSLVINGTRTDLFNIKIKGIKKLLLEDLKGKKVVIKGVKVIKTDMGVGTQRI